MAPKYYCLIFALLIANVESVSLWERSYEYVKSLAPSFMSFLDCFLEDQAWSCAKTKAGKMLDGFDAQVDTQRNLWQVAADSEARSSGRSFEELPSKLGAELESTFNSIAEVLQQSASMALARKKDGGGIDSITISTADKKKSKKKKKQKPPKIHLVHPVIMKAQEKGRGFPSGKVQSWVVGHERAVDVEPKVEDQKDRTDLDLSNRTARGMFADVWAAGQKALDAAADYAVENDNSENGITDKSSFPEQRGKKKKKKKAILKLLILGAVLKAKIATLIQILSFKLQVKFFIIALLGLGINLARFWLDLKKQHQQSPQKVIYYEHAQHQHHYDHEHEEEAGWGPWSRSIPEETENDDINSPYRSQENQYFTEPRKA